MPLLSSSDITSRNFSLCSVALVCINIFQSLTPAAVRTGDERRNEKREIACRACDFAREDFPWPTQYRSAGDTAAIDRGNAVVNCKLSVNVTQNSVARRHLSGLPVYINAGGGGGGGGWLGDRGWLLKSHSFLHRHADVACPEDATSPTIARLDGGYIASVWTVDVHVCVCVCSRNYARLSSRAALWE